MFYKKNGILAFYYNLPVGIFEHYPEDYLYDTVQHVVYKSEKPLVSKRLPFYEKIENYYKILSIDRNMSDTEKISILNNYTCCKSNIPGYDYKKHSLTPDQIALLAKLFKNVKK